MAGRVNEMQKTHIVYVFYRGESPETYKFWTANKIVRPPVIVVYDKGKPVARYEGLQATEHVLKGVKTRKEQRPWYKLW